MCKSLTIAIFIPSLRGGGAERAMVGLANGFARCGYKVDLVLADANGIFKKEISGAVRIVNLDSKRMAASVFRLARYLGHSRPDVLLSAMTHVNLTAIWARYIARVSTRLVISERSTFSQALKGLERRHIMTWLMPQLLRFFYPSADAVVSVSVGVQKDLLRHVSLPSTMTHVVYNPVVDDGFLQRAAETIAHPWFAVGTSPVVLAAGRLTEAKNFTLLLKAFALVRRKRPCRLMILGEGPLRHALETQVSDLRLGTDVLLPGFVDNPLPYMRQASVFVLSSSWEGLPAVLIQAMACGCRVVSTDCPSGPREILEEGRWGELVPVDDELALAEAIERCIDNDSPPDVRERAGFFNEAQSVEAYLKILLPSENFALRERV
jgi:glycosyltransferase involved in cell wall biosynthesis